MVVYHYVKANIGTHLIYDNDVKFKEGIARTQVTKGPRAQLKQILGVGIEYNF
jgi:hypothetical protein